MKDALSTTLVQTDLVWEDPKANRDAIESQLNALEAVGDVVVLPEMFTTGFTMNAARVAESMSGSSVEWMKSMASSFDCLLLGSLIIKEKDAFFNRLVAVRPSGHVEWYDKRHLFSMAEENKTFTAGTKMTTLEYKGWKLALQICYDLRFPVFSRNSAKSPYDVLVYVANWPAVRSHPWSSLLVARAIENQAYTIGVNRVGEDGKGIAYSGDSCAIDPKGNCMTTFVKGEASCQTVTLSREGLEAFRAKFPVLNDADEFSLS